MLIPPWGMDSKMLQESVQKDKVRGVFNYYKVLYTFVQHRCRNCSSLSTVFVTFRHGAEEVPSSSSAARPSKPQNFRGTGYKLGETEDSSETVSGLPLQTTPKQVQCINIY